MGGKSKTGHVAKTSMGRKALKPSAQGAAPGQGREDLLHYIPHEAAPAITSIGNPVENTQFTAPVALNVTEGEMANARIRDENEAEPTVASHENTTTGSQILSVPTSLDPIAPLQTNLNMSKTDVDWDKERLKGKRRDLDQGNYLVVRNNIKTRVDELALAMGAAMGIPKKDIIEGLSNLDVIISKDAQEDEAYGLSDTALAMFCPVPDLLTAPTPKSHAESKAQLALFNDPETRLKKNVIVVSSAVANGVQGNEIKDLPETVLHEIGHFLLNRKAKGVSTEHHKAAEEFAVELAAQSVSPATRMAYGRTIPHLVSAIKDRRPDLDDKSAIRMIINAGLQNDPEARELLDSIAPANDAENMVKDPRDYPTHKLGEDYKSDIINILMQPMKNQKSAFKKIKQTNPDLYKNGPEMTLPGADAEKIRKLAREVFEEARFDAATEKEAQDFESANARTDKPYAIADQMAVRTKLSSPRMLKYVAGFLQDVTNGVDMPTPKTEKEESDQRRLMDSIIDQVSIGEIRGEEIANKAKDSLTGVIQQGKLLKVLVGGSKAKAITQVLMHNAIVATTNHAKSRMTKNIDIPCIRILEETFPGIATPGSNINVTGDARASLIRQVSAAFLAMRMARRQFMKEMSSAVGSDKAGQALLSQAELSLMQFPASIAKTMIDNNVFTLDEMEDILIKVDSFKIPTK